MKASGSVVKVLGDYVSVAVSDEVLHEMGIRGTFVKIFTKKGRILVGIVSNVSLYDELYRQSGGRIQLIESYSDIALHRNEIIVSLLGTLKDGAIERKIDAIPSPGDLVTVMDENELKTIFSSGDIRIGVLSTAENVPVKLNINELATKHLAILAMTGSGKSNTLAVLLVRLIKEFDWPRILLIDTHSEYVALGSNDSPIKDKVTIYAPIGKFREILLSEGYQVRPLEIPYWMLTVEEWFSLLKIPPNATKQRRDLRTALRKVKEPYNIDAPRFFEINTLKSLIPNEDVLDKLDDALGSEEYAFIFNPENALRIIQDSKLVEKEKMLRLFKLISEPIAKDGLKIVALGGLSADIQNAVVSMILRTAFRIAIESKLAGLPMPTLIAIEEAHIYAPEQSYATTRQILERIAKEGRKFGIGLIIVSQRPREISQTVLAQCGNLIALRTVNPLDQRHIQQSLEDVTSALMSNLPGLGIGEAIISGPFVPIPCVAKIDLFDDVAVKEFNAKIQLGGKDTDFRLAWTRPIDEEALQMVFERMYALQEKEREKKKAIEMKGALDVFFGS